jgi:penicillin-binding protein 1B
MLVGTMATRPPARPAPPAPQKTPVGRPLLARIRRIFAGPRRRWLRITLYSVAGGFVLLLLLTAYFWVRYSRMIDAKLGTDQPPLPRVYARPVELRAGRGFTSKQLVERLNDIGYVQREKANEPGEFSASAASVTLVTREHLGVPSVTARADFSGGRLSRLVGVNNKPIEKITLEPALLAALSPGQKRRPVTLASIPKDVIHAVLAIEDRRFYDHPGVDVIRAIGALWTNIKGDRPYLVGGSTLTQQIIKNTFLTPAKTLRRKVQEQFMALVLDSRFTKDQILEIYLNDVVLGQGGPFEIRGVAEAARIFFGKHIGNVTLAEAATMAGLIQSPSRLSPFRWPERAQERRNVVLKQMAEAGFITAEAAAASAKEPLRIQARALENEAPYFVDYVTSQINDQYAGALARNTPIDVYTTIDMHLQRLAQEAVLGGVTQVEKLLAARRKKQPKLGPVQAALVALDPRTGQILAMVGGRGYNQSQYNRAVASRRQPGSTFKPFVYLAAFEKMAAEGRADLTPATILVDEPTTFMDGDKEYAPANYEDEYSGPMTLRRALALSRNVIAVKVAETTGYDAVAALWRRFELGTPARAFPSIALGVFEATPLEMATAFTIFPNGGLLRPLQSIEYINIDGKKTEPKVPNTRQIARPDTTYLVTSMMRSVVNEGSGAGVRANFSLDAAGKTGTTNEYRDAWFIGFTPELLTVVWVGYDDNQVLGLSGSQAAVPIWSTFMRGALAGRPNVPFEAPEGVTFADIDPTNGKLATFDCPTTVREAFLVGTTPGDVCDVHGSVLARIGRFFRRIVR